MRALSLTASLMGASFAAMRLGMRGPLKLPPAALPGHGPEMPSTGASDDRRSRRAYDRVFNESNRRQNRALRRERRQAREMMDPHRTKYREKLTNWQMNQFIRHGPKTKDGRPDWRNAEPYTTLERIALST